MDPELPFALVQAECVILIWLDLAASRRKVITIFLVLAKHAEYRRAEAFGEVPKTKSKGKANEEIQNEKIQHYLQMYKKQHTPLAIEAVSSLVEVNV
jgi:hypothetical protein